MFYMCWITNNKIIMLQIHSVISQSTEHMDTGAMQVVFFVRTDWKLNELKSSVLRFSYTGQTES